MYDIILHAAVEVATDSGREWNVQRPSRGAHASAVRTAATIPPRWQAFARCVGERESGNSYTARNRSSSAQGKYQFLDRSWRDGLAFMVRDRLVRAGMPKPTARSVREWLSKREIATWPGPYQEAGFAEVVARGGDYHWRLPGSRCETYR